MVNEALGGEVRVLGALTLNASVGGMNPLAVEIAAREGARILWMPTVDAANHRAFGGDSRRARSCRRGWPSSKILIHRA